MRDKNLYVFKYLNVHNTTTLTNRANQTKQFNTQKYIYLIRLQSEKKPNLKTPKSKQRKSQNVFSKYF